MRYSQIKSCWKDGSLFPFFVLFFLPLSSGLPTDCANAKRDWLTLRFQVLLGNLVTSTSNQIQPVCPVTNRQTCCDKNMENEIYEISKRQLSTHVFKWIYPVSQQMESDSLSLDYYFRQDLKEARDRLHESFSGIYGFKYQHNQAFFFSLFKDLDDYMAGRRGDLGKLIDNFFAKLRTSVVELIERSSFSGGQGNSVKPELDAGHIQCLSDSLGKQNAFDDVDVRLRTRLLEAYPPARMLVNSLAATSKLLGSIIDQVSTRSECVIAMARLKHCGTVCAAYDPVHFNLCPFACERFTTTCLSTEGPITDHLISVWPRLIEAIVLATTRLERSFNFPGVNQNLHLSISEAITFVQTKYSQVVDKLKRDCKPGSINTLQRDLSTSTNFGAPVSSKSDAMNSWPYARSSSRSRRNVNETAALFRKIRNPPNVQYQHNQRIFGGVPQASSKFHNWQGSQQASQFSQSASDVMRASDSNMRMQNRQREMLNNNHLSQNTRDRLIKWAGQLKQFYTGFRDLFKKPPSEICQESGSSSGSKCWDPPPIDNLKPVHQLQSVVNQLGEVVKRLRSATNLEGDPEALSLGTAVLKELSSKGKNASSSRSPSLLTAQSKPALFRQPQPPAYQIPFNAPIHRPAVADPWNSQHTGFGSNQLYQHPLQQQKQQSVPDLEQNSGYDSSPNTQFNSYESQPSHNQVPQYFPPSVIGPPRDSRRLPSQTDNGQTYVQPFDWDSSGMASPYGNQPDVSSQFYPQPGENRQPLQPSWQDQWRNSPSDNNQKSPKHPQGQQPHWQQPSINQWQTPNNQWPAKPVPDLGDSFENSGIYGGQDNTEVAIPVVQPNMQFNKNVPEESKPLEQFPPVSTPVQQTTTHETTKIPLIIMTPPTTETTKAVDIIKPSQLTPNTSNDVKSPVDINKTLLIIPSITTVVPNQIGQQTTQETPNLPFSSKPISWELPDDEDARLNTTGPLPDNLNSSVVDSINPPDGGQYLPAQPNAQFSELSGINPMFPPDTYQPQYPDGLPLDCSQTGLSDGSAVDPRCFPYSESPIWQISHATQMPRWNPVHPSNVENSGDFVQQPGGGHVYPGMEFQPDQTFNRNKPGEYSPITGNIPDDINSQSTQSRMEDREPSIPQFLKPDHSRRVLPPNLWVPGPGQKIGQVPESPLFISDFNHAQNSHTSMQLNEKRSRAKHHLSVTSSLSLFLVTFTCLRSMLS